MIRKRLLIAIFVLISLIIPCIATQNNIIRAEFVEPTDIVYGYRLSLSDLGVEPIYVKVLDRSRVLIVGTINGVGGVAVLRVDNPYAAPVIEDLYPLTGKPTYTAIDGYPVTRIAVGSDKGEILLLRIDRGVITRNVYRVLGADFYVSKIRLASAGGKVKIVVLVSEGGPPTPPCMNCYAYILDEDAPGVVRIGHGLGNVTRTCTGLEEVRVQDISPLAVYSRDRIYWDASNTVVAYIPRVITLVINLTAPNLQTGALEPARNALIEVRLEGYAAKPVVYGVNTDSSGIARIPIPYDEIKGYIVNLSIKSSAGNLLWNYLYEYDPKKLKEVHGRIPDEIPLPNVSLPSPDYDARPATKVYGTPIFLLVHLNLVDLTNAPTACASIGTADIFVSPSITGIEFLKGDLDSLSILTYLDTAEKRLHIATAIITSRGLSKRYLVNDYVGGDVQAVVSTTYWDGKYLIAGLSDGRLKVYERYGDYYQLINIYTVGSRLLDLLIAPGAEGYSYIALANDGIQVFRISQYLLPVFRNVTTLYLTGAGYIHGDSLADLSIMALVNRTDIVVIKNGFIAANAGLALPMDLFMAKNIELNIAMPGNENISGTTLIFRYRDGRVTYNLTRNNIILKNIIAGQMYTIDIISPKPHIYNASVTFRLRKDGKYVEIVSASRANVQEIAYCCRLDIGLRYKEYNVRLVIFDEISGADLIAPIDIYVDGIPVIRSTRSNIQDLRVLYGERNITIAPAKGFENIYQVGTVIKTITGDTVVAITVNRTRYPVIIRVADEYTGSVLAAPLEVIVGTNIFTVTTGNNVLNVTLPYGTYYISIRPAKGYRAVYREISQIINVPERLEYNIIVPRVMYTVDLTLRDYYSGVLIAPVNIYLNTTLLINRTTETTSLLNIPYGSWILRIVPAPGSEEIYSVMEKQIFVNTSLSLDITLDRVLYDVIIGVKDLDDIRFGGSGRIVSTIDVIVDGPVMHVITVEPPGRQLQLRLPYGEYRIAIEPVNKSIYIAREIKFLVNSSQRLDIPIERVKYRLEIKVIDSPFNIIRGAFELYINGTVVKDQIVSETVVELPYGVYTVQLKPMRGIEGIYRESQPRLVRLTGNRTEYITVDRRTYRLRIVTLEGATPVSNAIVTINNIEANVLMASAVTGGDGTVEVSLPYGDYSIYVKHSAYREEQRLFITVDRDGQTEIFTLTPTITTLIWRFAPIMGTLIGVGVAVYVIMKIRARIARRLIEEEVF